MIHSDMVNLLMRGMMTFCTYVLISPTLWVQDRCVLGMIQWRVISWGVLHPSFFLFPYLALLMKGMFAILDSVVFSIYWTPTGYQKYDREFHIHHCYLLYFEIWIIFLTNDSYEYVFASYSLPASVWVLRSHGKPPTRLFLPVFS